MKHEITTIVTKNTKVTIKVNREDLINMFKLWMQHNQPLSNVLPRNVKFDVNVYVPGGGDWSNACLNIDEDTPLNFSWEESSREVLGSRDILES